MIIYPHSPNPSTSTGTWQPGAKLASAASYMYQVKLIVDLVETQIETFILDEAQRPSPI